MTKKQSDKLRKEARGKPCLVRIPGVCNKDPETVVLAHLNNKGLFGVGTGQKVPDIFGAWCCSNCHDVVDRRRPSDIYDDNEIQLMFYEGCLRTMNSLLKENIIIFS